MGFPKITAKFGNPEIDLFESFCYKKCDNFVSWYLEKQALAVDAFTINWRNFFFYAFPPFAQIPKILKKIIQEKAQGILLVPNWPMQPWYPVFKLLLASVILFFKLNTNLVLSPFRTKHRLNERLSLISGIVSGRHLG